MIYYIIWADLSSLGDGNHKEERKYDYLDRVARAVSGMLTVWFIK